MGTSCGCHQKQPRCALVCSTSTKPCAYNMKVKSTQCSFLESINFNHGSEAAATELAPDHLELIEVNNNVRK